MSSIEVFDARAFSIYWWWKCEMTPDCYLKVCCFCHLIFLISCLNIKWIFLKQDCRVHSETWNTPKWVETTKNHPLFTCIFLKPRNWKQFDLLKMKTLKTLGLLGFQHIGPCRYKKLKFLNFIIKSIFMKSEAHLKLVSAFFTKW